MCLIDFGVMNNSFDQRVCGKCGCLKAETKEQAYAAFDRLYTNDADFRDTVDTIDKIAMARKA